MFAVRQLLVILIICIVRSICNDNYNDAESPSCAANHREKRFLTYIINGGIAKVIFGLSYPINFHHKLKRNLDGGINVQANYYIPPDIVWPVSEDCVRQSLHIDYTDSSRPQLYRFLERMIDSWGLNGKKCLLKTICEIAETPLSHNGMFGEILDVIFTPSEADAMDNEYIIAWKYGTYGVSCSRVFKECPYGQGLLDRITFMNQFKFKRKINVQG